MLIIYDEPVSRQHIRTTLWLNKVLHAASTASFHEKKSLLSFPATAGPGPLGSAYCSMPEANAAEADMLRCSCYA
jgi:hypothetical protein